ncbi:MAG: IclR family transcriptional regulator [Xanthobacteraceae bacterium]
MSRPQLAAAGPATETVDLSLRLLERLAGSRESIGVSQLAREFAASKATVYRHLQALARHGFLHQESTTMRYAAGIKLFILGERLRERFDVLPIAREDMLRLREETGQPATLSALVENKVVVLEVLQGHQIVNFGTQPGTVLDLHASAHGNVALAFGPPDLMKNCLANPLKAWTPQTICSPSGLQRAIAQVRTRGWATAPNRVLQGVNGLAAPLFNHAGHYVGAVAIAGSIQFIPASPPQAQIKAVTRTAERVSRKLGWNGRWPRTDNGS